MLDVAKSLPEDPDDLRRFTALLLAEVKSQALLIEKLRHQLAGHRNHRFGASSETIEQLQLALEASEIAIAKITAKLRLADEEPDEEKDKPKRRPIPDHIPRVEVELTAGDADCAQCGSALRRLGEDVTEELEYVPGRFVVNRIVRPRFTCTGCEAFTQAPLPSRPIERGRPGPGLLAHVLVNKYADHLPLYRQSQIFERDGLHLDRSTLADWVGKSTALLEPLADAIARHVLAGQAIFADDTPVQMLAPGVAFTYAPGRGGKHAETILDGVKGVLQVDGYSGYARLIAPTRVGPKIRLAHCWAHARRKLVELTRAGPSPVAEEGLILIRELYRIEAEIRGQGPAARLATRQNRSAPVMGAFGSWLADHRARAASKSPLGQALSWTPAKTSPFPPFRESLALSHGWRSSHGSAELFRP